MVGEFDVGSKSNPSLGKHEYITLGSSLNAAIDLHLSGDLVGAEKAYRSLIIQGQKDYAIYGNLAAICMVRGQREEAIKLLNQSLKLNPCYSEAYYNLGIALQLQGDLEAAIAHYQKALNLNPNYPEAYLNLGNTVRDRGDIEAAIAYYQKALGLNPNYPQIHYNLGHALEEQERWEDAIVHYRKAIELYPNYPEAHKNLSYALLITGDFKNGWDEYEYRFTNPTAQAKINIPRNMTKWDWNLHYQGELILVTEQGFGDAIQFIRYTDQLQELGLKVSVQCDRQLEELFSGISSIYRVYTHDYVYENEASQWYPLMSIPRVLGTKLESIPSKIPYLQIPKYRVQYWQEKLISHNQCFRIGIAWQGNPHTERENLRGRSFLLENFQEIANISGIELISLQKGFGSEQLDSCSFRHRFTKCQPEISENMSFVDTAAIMMNCDLIITSDTAIAHLAGALGKLTWLALKKIGDWRWMLDRLDSPWYPTIRLFRQIHNGEWTGVFQEIFDELEKICNVLQI